MIKAIRSKLIEIGNILKGRPTPEQTPGEPVKKPKVRIILPPGLIAYTFRGIIVVARNTREAKRLYEKELREKINLQVKKDIQE